ncbi:uncharacterized protein BJ212DRAFT_1331537 [Suillus subaureus]|uniref:Phospholipase n=1 Tax=Suillus subaureus TaxID=48587 RepID=A0A9P7EIS6_9AGAM|nr:uncharacterized protein BJ212DRAFT_1331537 [Suillus subaureus]KAG1822931.1 hypothetical protein BJ212DRAFT_1331537 [Suillus subaureus]
MSSVNSVNVGVSASHAREAKESSANSSGHGKHDDETGNVGSRSSMDQRMSRVESPIPISPTGSPLRTPKATLPDTPSNRTGPPRSLSFTFSHPSSSSVPRQTLLNGQREYSDIFENDLGDRGKTSFQINSSSSSFRGAFELSPSLGKVSTDKKGKARESRVFDQFHDSPLEERSNSMFPEPPNTIIEEEEEKIERKPMSRHQTIGPIRKSTDPPPGDLQRSQSHPPRVDSKKPGTSARWSKLRGLLPYVVRTGQPALHSVVTSNEVNITDELITGGLSTLMLRLWFERDEKGHRRIPVLLHRLRIRISDSLHPMQTHKAVFRIECEYANGAVRWVVYRQLRDFFSLHAHYTLSNAFRTQKDVLPEFPRTSLPYFKFLKKESSGRHVKQTDFARLQREALEDYLIKLIRAVMFHPTANRLAGFLEISALFITRALSGGAQYKAGFLRIHTEGNGPGFGRKSARWRERKEARWCAIRESYIVVVEDPGEVVIWDVFLFDTSFKIIRPTRYYRKGLHLLHPEPEDREFLIQTEYPQAEVDCLSAIDSIKSRLSRAFRIANRSSPNIAATTGGEVQGNGDVATGTGHRRTETVSSGSSAVSSRPATPMLDPSTHVNPLKSSNTAETREIQEETNEQDKRKKKKRPDDVSKHTFYVENSQMRLKLFARNERQMLQWITALEKAAATTPFIAKNKNRFDSFAPVRLDVAAQWLVDGRDYMWNLSRAILMAQETIYIHDWWLSPELQLRRPNKPKYRLDHLLERKAKEGVKIHIILYQEVSNRTTPTDSNYAKQRLISLHPNIMVQRSPSHFQTGTFYWAHHEKLCVIDETIAFMGGIDLCFGRWDTPQHVIIDDSELSADKTEIWPGKDYSNPRVLDFHALNKPFEDMYDRAKVPRMPWHDVGMQVVGQPARDLARHFVERFNHSRTMPFLLPPPEFKPGELAAMGLTGTCEMQLCRSAGPWSLGTTNRTEHSIQNAYLKAIEMSEHFVYIENQFFITSTVVNDIKIENRIGDALVDRITRAHREGTPWKCCIVIPLLPGFPFPIDHSDASAIRIIIECQNRTICRGPNSIFSRLRKEGIDPDEYISVFSLRNWAKMRNGVLTTEILYIHGKVCIVDDRLAIIGSANINERSQRGDRDSEIAAVIRDTDLIDGTMAGKPFKVGRFAHTLRMRLMREHVGVDVDAMIEHEPMPHEEIKPDHEQEWDPESEQEPSGREVTSAKHMSPIRSILHTAGEGIKQTGNAALSASHHLKKPIVKVELHKPNTPEQDVSLEEERMTCSREGKKEPGLAGAIVTPVEEAVVQERLPSASQAENPPLKDKLEHRLGENSDPVEKRTADGEAYSTPALASRNPQTDDKPPHLESGTNGQDELENTATGTRTLLRKHPASKVGNKTSAVPILPHVNPEGFEDPISDAFWKNVWNACAVHNTEIYRKVFHSVPDDLIATWKQYKEFVIHHERFSKPATGSNSPYPVSRVPSETACEDGPYQKGGLADAAEESRETFHTNDGSDGAPSRGSHLPDKDGRSRKPVNGIEPFTKQERDEMEELLKDVRGHLVVYPSRFLEGEDIAGNFMFNADRCVASHTLSGSSSAR